MAHAKVLYVDDELINLKLFELTFKNEFNILTALSGEEGLGIFEKERDIDVVVSDVRMPGLNGLEFIEKIKSDRPEIPCMLLSGYVDQDELWEGHDRSMIFTYMMKPWKREELLDSIRSVSV